MKDGKFARAICQGTRRRHTGRRHHRPVNARNPAAATEKGQMREASTTEPSTSSPAY